MPVVSSLALGFDGEYYNVNADQMASRLRIACGANALVYLTDVAGVKDADGAVLRWLEVNAIAAMVEQATVSGGMLPKLEACTSALKKGVSRVRILPATRAEVLPGFFTHPIDCGTEVIASWFILTISCCTRPSARKARGRGPALIAPSSDAVSVAFADVLLPTSHLTFGFGCVPALNRQSLIASCFVLGGAT